MKIKEWVIPFIITLIIGSLSACWGVKKAREEQREIEIKIVRNE